MKSEEVIKQLVEIVKSENPYSEKIFTEPSNEEWLNDVMYYKPIILQGCDSGGR